LGRLACASDAITSNTPQNHVYYPNDEREHGGNGGSDGHDYSANSMVSCTADTEYDSDECKPSRDWVEDEHIGEVFKDSVVEPVILTTYADILWS